MDKRIKSALSVGICAAMLLLLEPSLPALAISDVEVENQIRSILPTPEEDAWLKIGWHTNLMLARAHAQSLHKPLFLWIMDGHPLGCT